MIINDIHDSLLNGQRRQMADQIEEYGLYNFFTDYAVWLDETCGEIYTRYKYFVDATDSYHKIKNK
jgi:hypothetical protein